MARRGINYAGGLRPPWPFTLNRDSRQALNLVCWLPLGYQSGDEVDFVNKRIFTNTGTILQPHYQSVSGRLFDDAASQYLELASAIVSAPPFTLAGLVASDTTGGDDTIMCIGASTGTNIFVLDRKGSAANDPMRALVQGSAAGEAVSTIQTTTGDLMHGCAVFASSTSRTVYHNGANSATNTTSVTVSGANRTAIGRIPSFGGSPVNYFSGTIVDVRIYNVALDAATVFEFFSDPRLQLDLYYPLGRRLFFLPSQLQILGASSIDSDEAFGSTQLNLNIASSGIDSAEAIGTAELELKVTPTAIASAESIPAPFVGLMSPQTTIKHASRRRRRYAGDQWPAYPYTLNRDSPQAQGLIFWVPGGAFSNGEYDLISSRSLTKVNDPSRILDYKFGPYWNMAGDAFELTQVSRVLPLTLCAYGRGLHVNTAAQVLVYQGVKTSVSRIQIQLGSSGLGRKAEAVSVGAGPSASAQSTVAWPDQEWCHVLGGFLNDDTRLVIKDGVDKVVEATAINTSEGSHTAAAIGARYDTSVLGVTLTGGWKDVRIYNRIVTDDEAAAWFSTPELSFDIYYPIGRRIYFLTEEGPEEQVIEPSAITSAEATGTAQLNLEINPTGVDSAETHGTAKLNIEIEPAAIDSVEAHGTTSVIPIITTSSIDSAEAFGTAQLNLEIAPSPANTGETFGTLTTVLYVGPTGIATAEAFGTPIVKPVITPVGIVSSEEFGTAQLNFRIFPASTDSAESFGTAIVIPVISPTGIGSAEAFGVPQLNMTIFPVGITDSSFGTPTIVIEIAPPSIASDESFGTPALLFVVTPTGIASGEAFGTAKLNFSIFMTGIASAEAFGTANIKPIISPVGIASDEAFGTLQLNLTIFMTGIDDGSFGTAKIVMQIVPTSIASAEALGSPTLSFSILVPGIASAYASGTAKLNFTIIMTGIAAGDVGTPSIFSLIIRPASIASAEAFGTLTLVMDQTISPIGIDGGTFGTAKINRTVHLVGIASAAAFGTPILLFVTPIVIGIIGREANIFIIGVDSTVISLAGDSTSAIGATDATIIGLIGREAIIPLTGTVD